MSSNLKAIKPEAKEVKLRFDLNKFGKNLFEALLYDLTDLKPGTAIKKIFESFKFENNLESLTFDLIVNSLLQACIDLRRSYHQLEVNESKDLVERSRIFRATVFEHFQSFDLSVDREFFLYPYRSYFIMSFRELFSDSLISIGVQELDSLKTAIKLPEKFAISLENLLSSSKYNLVREHFQFSRSESISLNTVTLFEGYYKELQSLFQGSALGDSKVNLSDIYIEPGFKVYKKCFPRDTIEEFDEEGYYHPHFDGSIHQYIEEYFLTEDTLLALEGEQSRLLLLLGQPGQGKTSFCLKTCSNLINSIFFDRELVFFRIKDLQDAREFVDYPFEELKKNFNGYEYSLEHTLLIIDGLDELYMSQGLTDNEINDLLYRTIQKVKAIKGLFVIITARYNYISLDRLGRKDALILNLNTLSTAQQILWLKKYKIHYPECSISEDLISDINDVENDKYLHLRELINQPILLNLIVKADFDITDANNRASIYDQLFTTIIDRVWATEGQLKRFLPLASKKNGPAEMRDYISSIALKIYQSEFDYIYRSDLLEMEETKYFVDTFLDSKYENLDDALKDILVSFYFKNVQKNRSDLNAEDKHDFAIEFYHKSLQEFLAAEKIWNTILDRFTSKTRKNRYTINTWEQALNEFHDLIFPKPLTQETLEYLIQICENEEEEFLKEELGERLLQFFPDLLENDFLFKYDVQTGKANPLKRSCGCFQVYWAILSQIITQKPLVEEADKGMFYDLVKATGNLLGGYFRFSHQIFYGASLNNARLKRAIFVNSQFHHAFMWRVNLKGASIQESEFLNARLGIAFMEGISIKNSDFTNADFSGATIHAAKILHSYFRNTDCSRTDFKDSILKELNFENANLNRANFINANLQNIILRNVDLRGADFTRANLKDVDFSNSDLRGTDFTDAILDNVSFQDTRIDGIIVKNTIGIDIKGHKKE
ncbi:MAG: pentapeptide repeat-containing protein [Saprospiraceae bacterium]